jgi:hypothetical protein
MEEEQFLTFVIDALTFISKVGLVCTIAFPFWVIGLIFTADVDARHSYNNSYGRNNNTTH